MGLFDKKSAAEKQRKEEIKDAKKDAREDKREARQDAREEKQDARQDAREEKQDARQDARDEKKDAREDKRDAMDAIRDRDLEGKAKRDAKREVRDEKRDTIKGARDEKKDAVDLAVEEKKDRVHAAKAEKRESIEEIREAKRRALAALRVPKAFDRTWKSYLGFQQVDALEIYQPETLEHLQTICRIATDNGLKVRAIGSGHSFSQIGITDDVFVQTHKMHRMLPIGPEERRRRFKPEHQSAKRSPMAEFEIGISIVDLSKALEQTGEALENQGTYNGQTFWGAVSTSTHGSGIERDAFPAMVLSFVLVGEGGRTYRIEPRDGPTEPKGWREPGIDELIQNDDVFYSAVCSFGSMGIAYSALIRTRPFYWMDEWAYITTWDTVKSAFPDVDTLTDFLGRFDDVSFLVAPTRVPKGEKKGVDLAGEYPVSLTLRRETTERRKIGGNMLDDLAKLFEDVGIVSGKAPAEGRWWRLDATELRRDDSWMARGAVKNTGKRGWTGDAIDADETPIQRRDKCYEIFPKGGKLFGGYGIELAFPIARTIEIMDRIIELAAQNHDNALFHSAPVSLRFVRAASAYASPQYGRTTVMLEVLMAKGTEGGEQALALIEEALIHDPDCRMHWGLHVDRMSARNCNFAERYPRWPAFVATFRRFNAKGTFSNAFTDRIGLS